MNSEENRRIHRSGAAGKHRLDFLKERTRWRRRQLSISLWYEGQESAPVSAEGMNVLELENMGDYEFVLFQISEDRLFNGMAILKKGFFGKYSLRTCDGGTGPLYSCESRRISGEMVLMTLVETEELLAVNPGWIRYYNGLGKEIERDTLLALYPESDRSVGSSAGYLGSPTLWFFEILLLFLGILMVRYFWRAPKDGNA